jgi:hypothetical protein
VGISCTEGKSLNDELSIIGKDLFGFLANMSERALRDELRRLDWEVRVKTLR